MTFINKIELIKKVDQSIRQEITGTVKDLASELRVSRSTIYDILKFMRYIGADIEFCKNRQTFYFTSSKILALGYEISIKPDFR